MGAPLEGELCQELARLRLLIRSTEPSGDPLALAVGAGADDVPDAPPSQVEEGLGRGLLVGHSGTLLLLQDAQAPNFRSDVDLGGIRWSVLASPSPSGRL